MTPDLDGLSRTLAVRGLEFDRAAPYDWQEDEAGYLVVGPGSAVLHVSPRLGVDAALHLLRLAQASLDDAAEQPWVEVARGSFVVGYGAVSFS